MELLAASDVKTRVTSIAVSHHLLFIIESRASMNRVFAILFFVLICLSSAIAQPTPGASLGVYLADVNEARARDLRLPEARGALVGKVLENSPAAKAGLRENDVILSFDGQTIQTASNIYMLLNDTLPEARVLLQLVRDGVEREVTVSRDGHEAHLAVAATPLTSDGGEDEGRILVLDDVTLLVRAQRVAAWREVARRLAHEIKNPLTPIQLSAERLKRHFSDAPSGAKALVEECAGTIIGEVESLKGLVDEFSQFARMPTPKLVPTDLHALIASALALYDGILTDVRFARHLGELPLVRLDPEQIRRVILNVVDNAIEAMDRQGCITIETHLDASNHLVRLIISDNGPGIPPEEREKLFLPYYSTKRRGSGLGLAIVRRIIAEHGGTIDASDNEPTGTRFTIELPS